MGTQCARPVVNLSFSEELNNIMYRGKYMGLVYENITLMNAGDVTNVRRGIIPEADIRQKKVTAIVDTGAEMLIINETMRQELGLEIMGEQWIRLANETSQKSLVSEPVMVYWNNRFTFTPAVVLDGVSDVLLGAIPLEGLNVIVDPGSQRLVGAHGDEIIYLVK